MKLILNSMMIFAFATSLAQAADSNQQAFHDFGDTAGINRVVDTFVTNLLADPRMNHFFANIDQKRFKAKLAEQFCTVLEGPCTYSGKSMADAHDGLDVKHADFNALVEDLQKAMTDNHVPNRAQNKLLAKLAPMHKEIIGK